MMKMTMMMTMTVPMMTLSTDIFPTSCLHLRVLSNPGSKHNINKVNIFENTIDPVEQQSNMSGRHSLFVFNVSVIVKSPSGG